MSEDDFVPTPDAPVPAAPAENTPGDIPPVAAPEATKPRVKRGRKARAHEGEPVQPSLFQSDVQQPPEPPPPSAVIACEDALSAPQEPAPEAAVQRVEPAEQPVAAPAQENAPAFPAEAPAEGGQQQPNPAAQAENGQQHSAMQQQNVQFQQAPNQNFQQQAQRRQWMPRKEWIKQQRRQQMQQQQQRRPQQPIQPPVVPRDPNLPEYKLADIHGWDNAEIVAKLMPDANAEDLGAMKRHEIIFAAIRSYLARGGAVLASGCLEVVKEGFGFLRSAKTNFLACPEDVFIPQQQIRRHSLRTGDVVEGPIRDPRANDKFFALGGVVTVNGLTPSEAARIVHFENLVPTFPTRRIILETVPQEFSTRVVDIFSPIGFGQRGIIVAPPRVGKTVLLQKMANAITANHPEAILIVLLVDERPEEVTDMQRNTKALVLSSTFDEEPQHHVNVAEMVIEMSKRYVENGKDVVILLDSITRLARAYNTVQPHSGKILTGGVDALALHRPKRFFGAARNIENGGSLTIIATALIDTGSRMDEVIFEEFKGTGNMELVLDRGLADKRIFPAMDIDKSGTRKEDLLLDPLELEKTWALRRVLSDAGPERAMQSVLQGMKRTRSNPEFLLSLDLKNL